VDCASCHNESTFHKTAIKEGFDHNLTGFPLLGKHTVVDCKKCHHAESFTQPVAHNACASCHADYHQGQFVQNDAAIDCAHCHTVDGFGGSTFTLEQHAQTPFPLQGAHIATPCFACHKKADKWLFRNIGSRCIDCHKDIHIGQIDPKWYPKQACENCHTTNNWHDENHFLHQNTHFQLQGRHAQQKCAACHIKELAFPQGKFIGLSVECSGCHKDVHKEQFAQKGVTDCSRCHHFEDWHIPDFNHEKTQFKLDGKHVQVACGLCHKPTPVGNELVVVYKIEKFACIDCHK
jgi:hypothetical protein